MTSSSQGVPFPFRMKSTRMYPTPSTVAEKSHRKLKTHEKVKRNQAFFRAVSGEIKGREQKPLIPSDDQPSMLYSAVSRSSLTGGGVSIRVSRAVRVVSKVVTTRLGYAAILEQSTLDNETMIGFEMGDVWRAMRG